MAKKPKKLKPALLPKTKKKPGPKKLDHLAQAKAWARDQTRPYPTIFTYFGQKLNLGPIFLD
jgi:hypothetical protein